MSIKLLRKNESGATAVLVAASMILIMGMAALVVDYGLGLSERRLDQNVADAAVMGGAIWTLQNASITAGANEVLRLVDVNLGRTVTTAEWEACVDADRLLSTIIANNDCISWETGDNSWTLRVRVPFQDTETTFGKILGVDTLSTDAFAEATMELIDAGDILPFGLFGGSGGEVCLKDTSGPSLPAPCNGADTGQFGPFDVWKFRPGTGFCSHTEDVFVYSLGLGIDHPISTFGDYDGTQTEAWEECFAGKPKAPSPNTVNKSTGNKVPFLRRGLLQGDNLFGFAFSGRLAAPGSGAIIREGGSLPDVHVNNSPIWQFFIPGSPCATAASSAGPDPKDKKIASLSCIGAWAGGAPLFVKDFIDEQRIAFVPVYDELSTEAVYHINELVPVYLETLYLQTGGPPATQWDNSHSPGSPLGVYTGAFKALTAIVLDCDMMDPADKPCPSSEPGGAYTADLSTLKLSR